MSLVDDLVPGTTGKLAYAAIAAVLPASCALKPLFSATYATAVDAMSAFNAEGLSISQLGLEIPPGVPGVFADELRLLDGSSGSQSIRIALDYSASN